MTPAPDARAAKPSAHAEFDERRGSRNREHSEVNGPLSAEAG